MVREKIDGRLGQNGHKAAGALLPGDRGEDALVQIATVPDEAPPELAALSRPASQRNGNSPGIFAARRAELTHGRALHFPASGAPSG
jgi:hypothetical protein